MDTTAIVSNFWQQHFNISTEIAFQTLVPVVITLFVFTTGLIISWWREKNKEKHNNKLILEYVTSQIKVLLESIPKQIQSIEEFISVLQKERVVDVEFESHVDLTTKSIRYIRPDELFKSIVIQGRRADGSKIRTFNSLIKQLDLIDGINSSMIGSFQYFVENKRRYESIWNESISLIGDMHDSWITKLLIQGNDPTDDPFLNSFVRIYRDWSKKENYRDIYVAFEQLIDELIKESRKHQPNTFAESMIRPLLGCESAYANHKKLREFKMQEFDYYKQQLQKISKELNFIVVGMSSRKYMRKLRV